MAPVSGSAMDYDMRTFLALLGAATLISSAAVADPSSFRLEGEGQRPDLLVRHQAGPGPVVLYVHGATFPSGSSVAYRFADGSWMDDLQRRGFDVWAFDFQGFGGSDRPGEANPAAAQRPLRAPVAADQIEQVVDHILTQRPGAPLFILAHSWGTIPAALYATRRPEKVDRLVLFGPVSVRRQESRSVTEGGYLMTAEDQWDGFLSGLPEGEAPLISREDFKAWFADYLTSDPRALDRDPPAVWVPSGPQMDLLAAWSGDLPYDPSGVRAPTLIVRGEWDKVTTDADADWLVKALVHVPGGARDERLPGGAHRMHLERNRRALFDAVADWLVH